MGGHPVTLRVTDDLRRTRLTVAFRLILWIPHLIWLSIWGIAAFFAVIGNWFGTLFTGRPPEGLHRFLVQYQRYATHTSAYLYLLADPFPSFSGRDPYPIDLEVAPPTTQNRWGVAFRLILAIPVIIVANVLIWLLGLLGIISWFIALFTARLPQGLRDLGVFCLRFQQQTNSYIYVLTDRYPSFSYDQPQGEPVTAL